MGGRREEEEEEEGGGGRKGRFVPPPPSPSVTSLPLPGPFQPRYPGLPPHPTEEGRQQADVHSVCVCVCVCVCRSEQWLTFNLEARNCRMPMCVCVSTIHVYVPHNGGSLSLHLIALLGIPPPTPSHFSTPRDSIKFSEYYYSFGKN